MIPTQATRIKLRTSIQQKNEVYNNVQKTTKFVLFPSITVNDIRVHDRNWLTSIYKERIKRY